MGGGATLAAAVVLMMAARSAPPAPVAAPAAPESEDARRRAWLIPVAMAVSGAAAMVFEIAWTGALSLVIGSSTYAFTAVLVVVLIGIAAGSAVYAWRWGARTAGPAALGAIELGVGAFAALALLGFERLPDLLLAGLGWSVAPGWGALLQLLLSAAALLPATLCIGATFPCALTAVTVDRGGIGRAAGGLDAPNTVGAVARGSPG